MTLDGVGDAYLLPATGIPTYSRTFDHIEVSPVDDLSNTAISENNHRYFLGFLQYDSGCFSEI